MTIALDTKSRVDARIYDFLSARLLDCQSRLGWCSPCILTKCKEIGNQLVVRIKECRSGDCFTATFREEGKQIRAFFNDNVYTL